MRGSRSVGPRWTIPPTSTAAIGYEKEVPAGLPHDGPDSACSTLKHRGPECASDEIKHERNATPHRAQVDARKEDAEHL